MGLLPDLEAIKSDVESSYPLVIASVFHKCRVAKRDDLGSRHKNAVDLFETLVRFVCVTALQEARIVFPDLKDRLPQKEKTLEFLKRPSMGGWIGLLRTLCGLKLDGKKTAWLGPIGDWFRGPKTPETSEAMAILGDLKDINFQKGSKTPNQETLNALVNYRNKMMGHGANFPPEELRRRVGILETVLAHLMKSMAFLKEMTVFHTDHIEVGEGDDWEIQASRLAGLNPEPLSLQCAEKLEKREIYLSDSKGGRLETGPVPLTPFLIWRVNEDRKTPEVYFYNDAWRTKLEYLSYASGDHYYHKELHSAFEELITLKLKPGREEDAYRHFTPEERAQRAEELYKQAASYLDAGGDDRLEDALEALEHSAEFERRPETFLRMARVRERLWDPPDTVLQTVWTCLELDPENQEAAALRLRLQEGAAAPPGDAASPDGEEAGAPAGEMTLWHALTPASRREYAVLFWLALITAWFGFSAVTEYVAGYPSGLVMNGLQYGMACLGIVIVVAGLSLFLRLKSPLSLQLDTMRLERFEAFFSDQARSVFGHYAMKGGKLDLRAFLRNEKGFLIGGIVWTLVIGVCGFLLAELYRLHPFFMVKRWIDNIIPLGPVAYVVVRYILMSTLFVYRYSRKSLKPMLTKINDDGLRAFGPLSSLNIAIVGVIWALLWIHALHIITLSSYLDFFFVGVGSVIVCVWSIGMPMMIRRAARESKSKTVHAYSRHIEKAFRTFLEDPDDPKLERYRWLSKNQAVIRRIPTWPLSWKETLVVVAGGNLLLVAVDAWYVLNRLGRWTEALEFMKGLF